MNQDVLKIQVFTKAILIQHVQNVINKYCFLSELYILQVQ